MTTRSSTLASSARLAAPRGGLFTALLNRLAEWQERAEQRSNLAGMDDRMLKDIGVSPVDAARESSKPFWRA